MEQSDLEDTWFAFVEVNPHDLQIFKKKVISLKRGLFLVNINEGCFMIDKKKKTFRVVERMKYSGKTDYDKMRSKYAIDYAVYFVLKMAKMSGYTITLENKYSN